MKNSKKFLSLLALTTSLSAFALPEMCDYGKGDRLIQSAGRLVKSCVMEDQNSMGRFPSDCFGSATITRSLTCYRADGSAEDFGALTGTHAYVPVDCSAPPCPKDPVRYEEDDQSVDPRTGFPPLDLPRDEVILE